MTPAEKQKLLADVLAWVNEQRADLGLEPLSALRRGKKDSRRGCPVARSLVDAPFVANVIGGQDHCYWFGSDKENGDVLPEVVADFVFHFDRGDIPELDAVVA